jgi:anti-anti-sigma factor
MSQLAWFTSPRIIGSATERRRFTRYPAGPSLRVRLAIPDETATIQGHIHTISTAGLSLIIERPVAIHTESTLNLSNAARGFDCTVRMSLRYLTPYRDGLLVGGDFDQALSNEELARLTPTLSPWLEVKSQGTTLVGRFTHLDLGQESAVRAIGEQLFALVDDLGQRRFVLCFDRVRQVNCAFLSQLIEFRRRVHRADGRLALCGLDPLVQEIFVATSLNRVFRIYPSESEALHFAAIVP